MIKLVVVDLSAESRSRIVNQINTFLRSGGDEIGLAPRVSLKPLSLQEVKFHAAPDICVVGDELTTTRVGEILKLREMLPNSRLLVMANGFASSFSDIEQFARLGADDVVLPDGTPEDFIRKIIMLSRRGVRQNNGKLLIVDGGKGGIGVTSISAAVGHALYEAGKSVVLIDCDSETQDLSRFLHARPYINENLQLLLDEQRPISEEFVEQCICPIWQDERDFVCMPPPPLSDGLYGNQSGPSRMFHAVLTSLDLRYDVIVVDMAGAAGGLRRMLFGSADKVIFVVSSDPASLYASVHKLSRIRSMLPAGAEVVALENWASSHGLQGGLLRKEFNRAVQLKSESWAPRPIPFCRQGNCWPGSGGTLYSQGRSSVKAALAEMLQRLDLVERPHTGSFERIMAGWHGLVLKRVLGVKNAPSRPLSARQIDNRLAASKHRSLPQPAGLPASGRPASEISNQGEQISNESLEEVFPGQSDVAAHRIEASSLISGARVV